MRMDGNTPTTLEPNTVDLRQAREQSAPRTRVRPRWWLWLLVLTVLGYGGYRLLGTSRTANEPAVKPVTQGVPVSAVAVRQGDMPVHLTGLGSVTAFNTVTVKSRVDGQLIKVAFQEGQTVHVGDPLAEIDPRPFQVQLTQAEGQMARDAAQLQDAKRNLERYRELVAKQFIAKQQFDDQVATVAQYEGTVKVDQGLIDNA